MSEDKDSCISKWCSKIFYVPNYFPEKTIQLQPQHTKQRHICHWAALVGTNGWCCCCLYYYFYFPFYHSYCSFGQVTHSQLCWLIKQHCLQAGWPSCHRTNSIKTLRNRCISNSKSNSSNKIYSCNHDNWSMYGKRHLTTTITKTKMWEMTVSEKRACSRNSLHNSSHLAKVFQVSGQCRVKQSWHGNQQTPRVT